MENLSLDLAKKGELEEILQLYNQIIRENNTARWTEGEYPNLSYLEEQINNGSLFAAKEGDEIVSALVANHNCIPDYDSVPWTETLPREEVLVIHTFGVKLNRQRGGYGREVMRLLEEHAGKLGLKAIRLDTINGNDAGRSFYEKVGFNNLGVFELNYAETNETKFTLFEKGIQPMEES